MGTHYQKSGGNSVSESVISSPKGWIKAKDLKFETVKEDWNMYKLEDGTILRVKLVAGKISRGIDPETGEIFYLEDKGEPLYNITYSLVIIADVPKDLLRVPPKK
jgi:hypothetical protein